HHERNPRALLLGECQEPRREVAANITIKCLNVRDPETVEDREEQQRLFGRLSEGPRSLDEQACLIERSLSLRGRIAFGVHQSVHERDLKLYLLAAQDGRTGQGRNLSKRAIQLSRRLYERRTRQ